MTAARKFRKKPVVIEAIQWDGTLPGATKIIDWVLANGGTARYHEELREGIAPHRPDDVNVIVAPAHIAVDTLDSTARVYAGDWMMRGTVGEFYPCTNEVFQQSYEPAETALAPELSDEGLDKLMQDVTGGQPQ